MLDKINIQRILVDHAHTLRHDPSDKVSVRDWILFYVIPMLVAAAAVITGYILSEAVVNVLITSFSVFAALLFNLLILIYDLVKKGVDRQPSQKDSAGLDILAIEREERKRHVLKQSYSNISYAILVSLTVVILLIGLSVASRHEKWRLGLSFLIYALSANFILTLLMVLKRIHILLSKELESGE